MGLYLWICRNRLAGGFDQIPLGDHHLLRQNVPGGSRLL